MAGAHVGTRHLSTLELTTFNNLIWFNLLIAIKKKAKRMLRRLNVIGLFLKQGNNTFNLIKELTCSF